MHNLSSQSFATKICSARGVPIASGQKVGERVRTLDPIHKSQASPRHSRGNGYARSTSHIPELAVAGGTGTHALPLRNHALPYTNVVEDAATHDCRERHRHRVSAALIVGQTDFQD